VVLLDKDMLFAVGFCLFMKNITKERLNISCGCQPHKIVEAEHQIVDVGKKSIPVILFTKRLVAKKISRHRIDDVLGRGTADV